MIVTDRPEHHELRTAVRKLLEQAAPIDRVVEHAAGERGYDEQLWRRLAQEIGVAGLAIPERFGGVGATAHEDAVVAEELGRALAGTPYLSTVALAANLVLASGDEDAGARYLPAIAAGETTAAVAYRGPAGGDRVPVRATRTAAGWRLSGTSSFVLDGAGADLVLVLAATEAGAEGERMLFAGPGDATGLQRRELAVLDHTRRQAELTFDGVAVAEPLAGGASAQPWLDAALLRAAVSLAAEQVGGAERALESAVEYARLRVQFGRPIGSFQAIKHRCADLAVENDRARSALVHAIWAATEGTADELREAAALAALTCGPAFVRAAQESIQIHGGIGFTWEHPAHRYFRRAKADLVALAEPRDYREHLLTAVGV